MAPASDSFKQLLNRRATLGFRQLGYSESMAGEAKRQAW